MLKHFAYGYGILKRNILLILLQASNHPLTDLLNLNSTPSAGGSLLVDVFSDSPAPASTDVSEENFPRWDNTRSRD